MKTIFWLVILAMCMTHGTAHAAAGPQYKIDIKFKGEGTGDATTSNGVTIRITPKLKFLTKDLLLELAQTHATVLPDGAFLVWTGSSFYVADKDGVNILSIPLGEMNLSLGASGVWSLRKDSNTGMSSYNYLNPVISFLLDTDDLDFTSVAGHMRRKEAYNSSGLTKASFKASLSGGGWYGGIAVFYGTLSGKSL